MDIDSKELTDYIANVLKGIHNPNDPILKDYTAMQGVTFDLRVVHKKGTKGGLKILIASAEGEYEKEVVSKITFTMQHKDATKQGISVLTDMLSQFTELDKSQKLSAKSKKKS
ncbi:MAG: hypothetical protein K5793_02770 [Nitrosarchaeum sp.]|nr:hypothetical protein [Nitrosarchaeum sp.]